MAKKLLWLKDFLFPGIGGSAGKKTLGAEVPDVRISEKKIADNETVLGEGYRIGGGRSQKLSFIGMPDFVRKGHFWCFGTTRVGKTRILELMVEQDIRKGYSSPRATSPFSARWYRPLSNVIERKILF
jgi:hypothetical protein